MTAAEFLNRARRYRWPLAALVAALVITGYFAPAAILGPRVAVYVAARHDIVQTVVASGRVETPFRIDISSQIAGIVAEIPVDEGQFVTAGQPVIVLDDREEAANADQAGAAVAQAEAKLRQLRETVRPVAEETLTQTRATLLNAKQNAERVEALFGRGVVPRAQVDEARKSLDVAAAQLRAAELQAANLRPGGSDDAMAEAALRQANAALRTARVRLDHMVIRATRDGTLIERAVERGEVVQPGKTLMVLAPVGETRIVVQIDEKNLGLLAIGQKALASAEAFPLRSFSADLSYINPSIDAQRGAVAVRLRVPSPPPYLRQDMTISVDIEVARRAGALVVPADAVRDIAGAAPWVMAVVDGRATRRPVAIGARSVAMVEILDGLKAGDRVIPATRVDIAEGRRLRANPP
ncbi:MAG: efflux RND transporter periplasmic adaptor subunit [Rhodospirillales bacterium]|nr:efflux RND transporter periplasmic adaptor subunit [Rhodospirillales bacterium]